MERLGMFIQERLVALDAEFATLSAVPTEKDVEVRIKEIARLVPDALLLALFPESARALVSAVGRVRFDRGVISIDYADEYRDLFPSPHRVTVKQDRSNRRWVVSDCC